MHFQCHLCGSNSALHPLPSDPIIAEKWKEAVPDATPDVFTPTFRLCVQHFDKIYIFQKRHLLKWAIPELIHFNGTTWQKERCDYTPEVSQTQRPKPKTPVATGPPPVVIQPAPSNVDESPVVLPLPPRREDEPDTDPLAVPEPIIKTPIISSVTSLRPKTPSKSSQHSRSRPSLKQDGGKISASNSSRLSHPGEPPIIISSSPEPVRKPKISVKSPAELSAPKALNSNFVPTTIPPPRILNKRAPQDATTTVPFNKVIAPNQPAIIIPPLPNQPQYQFIISPNSSDRQYIISPTSSGQYIMTPSNMQNQTIVVSEKTQGQPILFTDTGHQQPLLLAESINGTQNQPIFFQNQPILLTAVSPQATITPSQKSNLVISDARSLHPDTNRQLNSPKTTAQHAQPKTPANPQPATSQTQSKTPSKQKSPNAQSGQTIVDTAEYTEKLTRQAIATVKADIVKTQKKSQILQKKIDLLKLKVSTYEGLISKLVSSNIISKQSANQCRVLQKDVNRFKNKRKSVEGQQDSAAKKGREIVENNKENSNDTVDSMDSSTAKDHDYL